MSANLGWNEERDATLLKLLTEGLSGRLAGMELGTSRQSALARARKLGFVWSHAPINEPNFNKRSQPLPAKKAMPFEPLYIPLVDLKPSHCREVVSQDGHIASFCGHPKSGKTSYCNFHRGINLVMVAPKGGRPFPMGAAR